MENYEIDWQELQQTIANGDLNPPATGHDIREDNAAYQLNMQQWLDQMQNDSNPWGSSSVDRPVQFPPLLPPRPNCGAELETEAEAELVFQASVHDDVTTVTMDDLYRRIKALEAKLAPPS